MKLQVWIRGYEFESIQFCPPLVLKHKSGKSKANRLKQVKACVQSLLTMHASEDMPASSGGIGDTGCCRLHQYSLHTVPYYR